MKIKNGTLVLVADGSKMLLFRNEGDEKFPVFETLGQDKSDNLPSREQGTDTPGRTHASMGDRRSSYSETDWQQQAEDEFAQKAASKLEEQAKRFDGVPILVAAAPRALGQLRKHYGHETRARLHGEIDKDLANQDTDRIIEVILAQPEA